MANSPERDTQDLPLLQEARFLWSQKRWSDALERFEAAHAASPQNLRATIELARALGQRYQIERAEHLLHYAWEKAGVDLQLASAIAQSYRLIHRPLKAIAILETIRTTETLPPALLGELSVLYEQTNRLEEARVIIRECVESAPGQPEPILLRARIERVAGNASHSRRILEGLLKSSQLSPLLVARAWSEVSQVADAQGEYREAMEAVERSKDVLRSQPRVDLLLQRNVALNQCLQGIHSQLDTSTLDDWRDAYRHLEKPFPNVAHLLGFPRSGTTLLEQILESHPKLVSSSELPVFSREIFPEIYRSDRFRELSFDSLRYVDEELLTVLRLRYLDYLQAVLGQSLEGRVHLDKNPNHTGLIAGLLRLFPDSHFVFAVRDPRDVVISAYMQYFPLTEFSASLLTFESAVAQYANDMEIGLRVASLLPEQWTPVRYEDVVRDRNAEVRRVLSRLGLSWDPAIEGYRERIQQAIINSPSQASVRQPVYARSMERWKNYEAYLRPWLQTLNRYCVAFGYESA